MLDLAVGNCTPVVYGCIRPNIRVNDSRVRSDNNRASDPRIDYLCALCDHYFALDRAISVHKTLVYGRKFIKHKMVNLQHVLQFACIYPPPGQYMWVNMVTMIKQILDSIRDLVFAAP